MSASPSLVNKPVPPLDLNAASVNIPVSKIIRSETNREAEVDDAFVESIRQHGVLQPIILRRVKASIADVNKVLPQQPFAMGEEIYMLVAGERRWLASIKAKKASIPAIIRELTDTQAVEIQVEENEQRENLSPMDRSAAYCRLRDQYMKDHAGDKKYSATMCIEDVAKNRKVESRTVHQVIALSKLEPFLQAALRQGEMEASHGYEIARLEPEQQVDVLKWVRDETRHSQGDVPSVRRLKREISQMSLVWESRKRQEKLFKEPQPGTSTTKVPTIAEAHASERKAKGTPSSQLAAEAGRRNEAAAFEKQRLAREKKEKLSQESEQKARNTAMDQIAKKAKFDRSLVNEVLIDSLAMHTEGPALFAVRYLGWQKPRAGHFSSAEIEAAAKKNVPKMKPCEVAALLIACLLDDDLEAHQYNLKHCQKLDAMARRFKVNLSKIRKGVLAQEKAAAKKKAAA